MNVPGPSGLRFGGQDVFEIAVLTSQFLDEILDVTVESFRVSHVLGKCQSDPSAVSRMGRVGIDDVAEPVDRLSYGRKIVRPCDNVLAD